MNPYESKRIKTNRNESSNLRFLFSQNESTKRIFQKQTYESNPQYESLRFGFANPDSQIQNFRIRKDSDSRISIFKYSLRAIVLRIRKDLLDLLKQVNLWKLTGFMTNDLKRIFWSQDSWSTIRYESRICIVGYESNLFGVRIRGHDTVRIHVFTNLLYKSSILRKRPQRYQSDMTQNKFSKI